MPEGPISLLSGLAFLVALLACLILARRRARAWNHPRRSP
jgi:hypothetical protein